jgi:hypothetical protein
LPFVRAGDLDAGQITPTKDFLAEPSVKAASSKVAIGAGLTFDAA